jgi:hypothetical protein
MPSRTAIVSYYDSSCGRVAEYTQPPPNHGVRRSAQPDIPANHYFALSPISTSRRMVCNLSAPASPQSDVVFEAKPFNMVRRGGGKLLKIDVICPAKRRPLQVIGLSI